MFEAAGMENPKLGTVITARWISLNNFIWYSMDRWNHSSKWFDNISNRSYSWFEHYFSWFIIKGGIKLLCVTIAISIVDRFGRKTLLLISYSGQVVCTFIVGSIAVIQNPNNESLSLVAVTFIVIFMSFFQMGAGPIPIFLTSELVDTSKRSKAQDSV